MSRAITQHFHTWLIKIAVFFRFVTMVCTLWIRRWYFGHYPPSCWLYCGFPITKCNRRILQIEGQCHLFENATTTWTKGSLRVTALFLTSHELYVTAAANTCHCGIPRELQPAPIWTRRVRVYNYRVAMNLVAADYNKLFTCARNII
jgi:hypothetical protein